MPGLKLNHVSKRGHRMLAFHLSQPSAGTGKVAAAAVMEGAAEVAAVAVTTAAEAAVAVVAVAAAEAAVVVVVPVPTFQLWHQQPLLLTTPHMHYPLGALQWALTAATYWPTATAILLVAKFIRPLRKLCAKSGLLKTG